MGIAIVIPKIKYKGNNLGKVAFKNIDMEGLLIEEVKSSYTERAVLLNIEKYIPGISASIGVYWEITEGSEYASINADGLLTINPIADNNEITVKAYSKKNSDVFDTVTFTITYMPAVNRLDDINDIILTKYKDYENRYLITPSFVPENTNYTDVSIYYNTTNVNYNDVSTYTKIKNGNILIVKKAENTLNIPLTIESVYDNNIKYNTVESINYIPEKSWDLAHYIGMINLLASPENGEPLGKLLNDNKCTLLVEMSDECMCAKNTKGGTIFSIGLDGNGATYTYGSISMGGMHFPSNWSTTIIPITTYNALLWNTTNTGMISAGKNIDYKDCSLFGVKLINDTDIFGAMCFPGRRILTTDGRIFIDNIEISNMSANNTIDEEAKIQWKKTINRNYVIPRYLTFGFLTDTRTTNISANYTAPLDLYNATTHMDSGAGDIISDSNTILKIKKFIIVPGVFTTYDEVLSNNIRNTAYVDILIDDNGVPYNKNTNYPLLLSDITNI